MPAKHITLGIILDDIVFPDGRTMMGVLGGGGPQTAWGMAVAANDPADVGLVAGIGSDAPDGMLTPLQNAGIDLSGVHVTRLPTPRAWQLLEEDGRRTHVWRVDQATSDLQTHPDAQTILSYYPDTKLCHWGIHPEDPHLRPCKPLRNEGVLISIEPFKGLDSAPDHEALLSVLSQCDIYSPTWAEATSIFGTTNKTRMLAVAREAGTRILCLRRGAAGSEAWDLTQNRGIAVPAVPVEQIIDPVGAGDAYCGAFAVCWQQTEDLAAAVAAGAMAASYMLEQIGIPMHLPSQSSKAERLEFARSQVYSLKL